MRSDSRHPKASRRNRPPAALAAWIFLVTLPATAFGHPDLVLQIETLDRKIQAGEANAELLIKRGDLHRRHRDFAAAARDFEAARKLSPGNTLIDFYQGRLQLESGNPGAAERHLALYLSSNGRHARAWMLRGEANIQLGRPEIAADYFDRAIQTANAPSPGLYRQLILSRVAIGETAWGAAANAADTGLARFGTEVTLLGLGIDIALARNQPGEARRYLSLLPGALHSVPEWGERIRNTECISSSPNTERAACLQFSRADLARQAQSFITDIETRLL
jgi:tetratricopeptide (TPR) repeat protein